jgi:signal transduction histidine kinase
MRRSSLFFTAHPLRLAGEILLLGSAAWLFLFLLRIYPPFSRVSSISWMQISFAFLGGPACMCWCAVRLRRLRGSWWRRWLTELLIIVGLSTALNVCGQFATVALLHASFVERGRSEPVVLFLVAPLVDYATFFICRAAMRVWVFWDRLRRTQLTWGLTHAHVILLSTAAGLLILLIDIFLLWRSNSMIAVPMILPMTILLVFVSICVLVAVMPAFAIFSYFAMRRTVHRLRLLADATGALRHGNYGVRVPVVGEDEVAQLQSDFNAMATELQRAMRELQGERDTVAKLLLERRELIANVSHELRTPVATLRGYLETTLMHWNGVSPATLHHDLRVMEDETVHLQGLVEDLFTLSRAEVGQLELHCASTQIGALVRRVVDASAPLAWRSSRIEMVAEIPAELPNVVVDGKRMEQVLQNLLHNAVRHTPPGGIVAVMVTTEAREVVIQVKDTGEGIAAEDLPHIWQRFYQATSSRMGGGSGLGLALVKEWVESMQGSVSVESVPDKGSCFSVRLPTMHVTQPLRFAQPLSFLNSQEPICGGKQSVDATS